jgi:hypothetical protein
MPKIVPSQVIEVIDQALPQCRVQQQNPGAQFRIDEPRAGFLQGIVDMVSAIPAYLLPNEPRRYLEFLAGISAINQQIVRWRTHPGMMDTAAGYDVNPLTLIRRALSECPDEAAPAAIVERFAFLADPVFVRSVAGDTAAAEAAMSRSEFKVTVVMAGACIEALLLWKLRTTQNPAAIAALFQAQGAAFTAKANPNNILEWGLYDLIEGARLAGLINERAKALATFAKDFRNLIHPGREMRTGTECKRSNAATAIAALETVIEQVQQP